MSGIIFRPNQRVKKSRKILLFLSGLALGVSAAHASTPDPAAIEFFEKKIRPILVDHCYKCHSRQNKKWIQSPVDNFILAKLEEKNLKPATAADKRTLIRRATFDLIGLPPTPDEVEKFLADKSSDAFARVVDRLLASPQYGERWGRHWLDLARYTDSFDARLVPNDVMDATEAWRYRDWVVNAFNRDLPYDQFVRDQVAGDVLPGRGTDGVIATGLLAIGNWGGGDADKEKLLTDVADDQLDIVCRTFLGLTVACARCHDHKFDPITQKDYYGLAGIFFSTHILPNVGPKTNGPDMLRIPIDPPKVR